MTDEKNITEDDVRAEHMASAKPAAHWAYLVGVLGGSFILMVLLIALMGSAGG
jgi:uncharacterized membrane protein YdcZ (DUF606 family)